VGISSLKSLKDSRVLIETESIQEAEAVTRNIRDKIGEKLEANIQRPRNPRLRIHNIPEDISIGNIEETLIAQNPHLGLEKGEINPKFTYETKSNI
jgi:hypothetical protein